MEWSQVNGATIGQGDYLPGCSAPAFGDDFDTEGASNKVTIDQFDLIVITQSCDLEHHKVRRVALVPVSTTTRFEQVNEQFSKKGAWDQVKKGRVEGLYLLSSPTSQSESLVVTSGKFSACRTLMSQSTPYRSVFVGGLSLHT